MTNSPDSAAPEQKLSILTAELLTPIEIIRGFAYIIKKDIETNNIDPDKLLEHINKIIEKADWIKELRDEAVKS
jgi:signal transduction histidine kinase